MKENVMSAMKQVREELSSVDQAIAWHDGDQRATIKTLLEDCRFLREQLDVAAKCMSSGLTRGLKPSSDR
jgi:predicted phage gp36 major capsid-like protein